MTKKLNKLFKLGFALVAISLFLTNCEKENVHEKTPEAESQESTLILKQYTKEDIEKETKLVSKLREFSEKLNENKAARNTGRAVYNSEYDFTIYTDAATYIENGDYHSYTFPLVQGAGEKMANIFFELNDQGDYDAYLVRYDYTANEFSNLDLNTLSLETVIEPIDLDFGSLTTRAYAAYVCINSYERI